MLRYLLRRLAYRKASSILFPKRKRRKKKGIFG